MGGIFSYLWSFVAPAPKYDLTPDPTTGLTERDRELITQTWALVADRKSIKKNGVEFFIQLFEAYPYTQDLFEHFKGKAISELRTSPKMRAHAASVFYVLTSYVENLDDPETLVGLVQKIAVTHVARGTKLKEFENLRIVFLQFVKSLLGTQYTPEIELAWDKLLKAQNSIYKMTEDDLKRKK